MTKKKGVFVLFLLMFWIILSVSLLAQKKIPASFCISSTEKRLADEINQLRKANGKPAIPLSISLSFVAKTHVADLIRHHPDTGICNLSSWSNKGHWKACCYNPYFVHHSWMWNKPRELTNYPYRGYEIAAYTQNKMLVDSAMAMWKVSPEAMNMILTEGPWKTKSWACMGVGVNEHYVSVWFGQRPDRAGKPRVCRGGGHKGVVSGKIITKKKKVMPVFFLIYGSYPGMNSAKKVLDRLKSIGFRKAGILKSHKHVRVYLHRTINFQQIKKERQRLKKKYPKLWILQE